MCKRGDIYYVDFGEKAGSEQGGVRPALVVSNNKANKHSPVVTVIPLSARVWKKKYLPTHVQIDRSIDLHRDGVADTTRLATNINGVDMAQVMFFNGLSKTTATGDIDYLRNPYIEDNLAMSLKMQLAATELYPGFTRKIYLKSYRYNMHLCPKSLLIEVGAQTNTLQEAVNAMDRSTILCSMEKPSVPITFVLIRSSRSPRPCRFIFRSITNIRFSVGRVKGSALLHKSAGGYSGNNASTLIFTSFGR